MSRRGGGPKSDALLLDEMFSPRIAERLRALDVDCVAVAEHAVLVSQDDPVILGAAHSGRRVLVTNNVVDFERLRQERAANNEPVPPLIYTSEAAFPRNRRFIGRLVESLGYAAANRLVHASGGVLWLAAAPPAR
jgi:hypothetical protein